MATSSHLSVAHSTAYTWSLSSHLWKLWVIVSYSMYSRRHIIGCRRRSALLWLVMRVRLIITRQSAILRFRLWEWSVATPSELFDWQERCLDIYLFYICSLQCYDAIGWVAGRVSVSLPVASSKSRLVLPFWYGSPGLFRTNSVKCVCACACVCVCLWCGQAVPVSR